MGTPTIPNIRLVPLAEDSQLTVWWEPPSSGTPLSYRLTLNPGNVIVTGIPGTWQEYPFTSLVNGTEYTITIDATNNGSTYGPAATFFPATPGGAPLTAPQNAFATPAGSNAISIVWSPPSILPNSPIDSYIISGQSDDPNVPTISYTQVASGGTSALITGVNITAAYRFTIQAVNDVGVSPAVSTNSVCLTQSYGIPDWAVPSFANIRAGGNNFRNIFNCITSDTQNNIYVAGQCWNSTLNLFNYYSTLGNGTISTTSAGVFVSTATATANVPFMYIAKYTSSGNVAWFAPILPAGTNIVQISGLITDTNNNLYITHGVAGGFTFTYFNAQVPGLSGRISTGTVYGRLSVPNAGVDTALAKYNSDGVVQWVTLNGSGLELQLSQQRNSLVADSQNNVYSLIYSSNFTSTLFNSAAGVTGGVIQHSTVARLLGDADTTWANQNILTKYDTNGQFQWATKSPCYYQANAFILAIDSNDNVFMGANLSTPSTVVFNYAGISSGVISTSIYGRMLKDSTQVGLDGLVIKYNSNGQAQWVVQQTTSSLNTSVPPRTIATDIYGNLYTMNATPNSSTTPIGFNSFQRVTDDLYISTISSTSAIPPNLFYIAKYDSNGQIVKCAGQSQSGTATLGNSGTLMTDYIGNVYSITNDSSSLIAGASVIIRDFDTKNNNNNIYIEEWGRIAMPFTQPCMILRKMNNNLETQYVMTFSNLPYFSTTFITASNMCIDRNNYVYIAGTAAVSSLTGVTVQSSIPLPQWTGVAGGPYSFATPTLNPASVSISSIITSTTTYSFLIKYK
jgi:hypothetical protein